MRLTDSPENPDTFILCSYYVLRWCMSSFTFILPLLFVLGNLNRCWWISEPLTIQSFLSAYYHIGSDCTALAGIYRDLLVGVLTVIAAYCIVYSFGNLRNWLLNIANVCLAGAVFFPTDWPELHVLATSNTTPSFQNYKLSKLLDLSAFWAVVSSMAKFLMLIFIGLVLSLSLITGMSINDAQLILWVEWVGMWALFCSFTRLQTYV